MSVRIRWNNLSNAIIDLSRPLWRSSVGSVDGDTKHLREVADKHDKPNKSCQPCESDKTHPCACHPTRTCDCASGDCADNDGDSSDNVNNNTTAECSCGFCRDYAEYTEHTTAAEGKGDSPRVRFSNELRFIKQTSDDSTTTIEHSTRLSTGVTL